MYNFSFSILVADIITAYGCVALAFAVVFAAGLLRIYPQLAQLLTGSQLPPGLTLINILIALASMLPAFFILGFGQLLYCTARSAEIAQKK